jgi:cytoskeletal protein RodZ
MTIEGLGKKFQEARFARNMTLDEAARITKIRPSRLAEIEADDFSQFPSLAYAKGFLLIYGKSLDVDVTPYMEAFETSEHVTVDGYSYLQDNPAPKPARTPVVRHRSSSSSSERTSLMPLVIGIIVLAVGFFLMKFILDIQRIAPRRSEQPQAAQGSPSATAAVASSVIAPAPQTVETPAKQVVAAASVAPALPPPPTVAPTAVATAPPSPAAPEPEVRRAEPVRPEDLAKAGAAESAGPNRVAIRPLKKTYIKVVVDNEAVKPAFERWISPADGSVEFRGQKIAVRVLDRDAVQIKKNGKLVADDDSDVTIE